MSNAFKIGLLLVSLWVGCGGHTPLGASFPVNRESELASALARARATPRPSQRPVVVGISEAPRAVFAYDLSAQRLLWKQPAEASGVPVAAGDFVVSPEGGVVRVRALDTGNVVHELAADGMHLVGADGDGRVTAIVLSTAGSMGARSRVVLLDGASVVWDARVDRPVGGPAVLGGLVFVPHNRVHLSVLDTQGRELARVRIRADVASQALVRDGDVYFGLAGIHRLDEHTGVAEPTPATYFRDARQEKLPGQPAFLPDTTTPPAPPDSAVQHVALTWVPEHSAQGVGLADDTLYLLFYRQLYALEPNVLRARWVFQTPTDAVGVRAVPGGVIVVDDQGKVSALDAAGRTRFSADIGVRPVVARIRADRFDQGAASGEAAPLSIQLVDAALNPDARLVPARAMAVELLAHVEDEDATNALIEICQDRATPERVRKVACVALSKRTIGADAIIAALSRHADYLTDAKAPPVGPLSEAALHAGDARAVPALVGQLEDPETPVEELPALMLALKGLADASAAPAIAAFLRLYHADADDSRLSDALVIAVEALVKIQGAEAQNVLEPVANDALSAPAVKSAAARALAGLVPPPKQDAKPSDADKKAAPTQPAEPAPEPTPARLTAAHVDKALAPVKDKLAQCLRNDARRPASARLTLVAEPDGKIVLVKTLPESLQSCVEPLVKSVTLPESTWGKRDTLSTTITR